MTASVELKMERMWCDRHIAPFEPRWPVGIALATPVLFTGFAQNSDVVRYCDGGDGRKADPQRLDAALREFQPACCRVPDEWLARVVAAALAGDTATCVALQNEVLGARE